MCKHVRVKYACGHIRYCVMCWCSKYTDLQKCCPLKVRRHETLSFQVCGCCRDTNSLTKRVCMGPKSSLLVNRVSKSTNHQNKNGSISRPKSIQVS